MFSIKFDQSLTKEILLPKTTDKSYNLLSRSSFLVSLYHTPVPKFAKNLIFTPYQYFLSSEKSPFKNSFFNTLSEFFRKPLIYENFKFLNSEDEISSRYNYPKFLFRKERVLSSPVNGKLVQKGKIKEEDGNFIVKIKNEEIKMSSIIENQSLKNFNYALFYLSPKDYHRFHSPIDFNINKISFKDGKLEVMQGAWNNIKRFIARNLYNKNTGIENYLNLKSFERNKKIVFEGNSDFGKFYYVAIGSKRVGSLYYNEKDYFDFFKNKFLVKKKFDEIGQFDMDGSAILLVFESDKFKFDESSQKVTIGDSIGNFI